MRKIVLDQFGSPWGYADVEPGTREIEIAGAVTIDGAPVDMVRRKVSSAKKHDTDFDAVYFLQRAHNGRTFFIQ